MASYYPFPAPSTRVSPSTRRRRLRTDHHSDRLMSSSFYYYNSSSSSFSYSSSPSSSSSSSSHVPQRRGISSNDDLGHPLDSLGSSPGGGQHHHVFDDETSFPDTFRSTITDRTTTDSLMSSSSSSSHLVTMFHNSSNLKMGSKSTTDQHITSRLLLSSENFEPTLPFVFPSSFLPHRYRSIGYDPPFLPQTNRHGSGGVEKKILVNDSSLQMTARMIQCTKLQHKLLLERNLISTHAFKSLRPPHKPKFIHSNSSSSSSSSSSYQVLPIIHPPYRPTTVLLSKHTRDPTTSRTTSTSSSGNKALIPSSRLLHTTLTVLPPPPLVSNNTSGPRILRHTCPPLLLTQLSHNHHPQTSTTTTTTTNARNNFNTTTSSSNNFFNNTTTNNITTTTKAEIKPFTPLQLTTTKVVMLPNPSHLSFTSPSTHPCSPIAQIHHRLSRTITEDDAAAAFTKPRKHHLHHDKPPDHDDDDADQPNGIHTQTPPRNVTAPGKQAYLLVDTCTDLLPAVDNQTVAGTGGGAGTHTLSNSHRTRDKQKKITMDNQKPTPHDHLFTSCFITTGDTSHPITDHHLNNRSGLEHITQVEQPHTASKAKEEVNKARKNLPKLFITQHLSHHSAGSSSPKDGSDPHPIINNFSSQEATQLTTVDTFDVTITERMGFDTGCTNDQREPQTGQENEVKVLSVLLDGEREWASLAVDENSNINEVVESFIKRNKLKTVFQAALEVEARALVEHPTETEKDVDIVDLIM